MREVRQRLRRRNPRCDLTTFPGPGPSTAIDLTFRELSSLSASSGGNGPWSGSNASSVASTIAIRLLSQFSRADSSRMRNARVIERKIAAEVTSSIRPASPPRRSIEAAIARRTALASEMNAPRALSLPRRAGAIQHVVPLDSRDRDYSEERSAPKPHRTDSPIDGRPRDFGALRVPIGFPLH